MIKGILSFFNNWEIKEDGLKKHANNFEKTETFIAVFSKWADICNGVMLKHNIKGPKVNIFVGTKYNLMEDTKNGGYYPFILISEKEMDLRILIFKDIKEQYLFCLDTLREQLNFDKYMANSIKEGRLKMFRFKLDGNYYTGYPNVKTKIYHPENTFLDSLFGKTPLIGKGVRGTGLYVHNYFLLSTIKESNYFNYAILQKPTWVLKYEQKLNGEN